MKPDVPLTELTEPHKEVLRYLQCRGLAVWHEVSFPPYFVDLYLPRYHAAVEVNGPLHVREKDDERDEELLAIYRLPVHHIVTEDAKYPERWWMGVAIFLNNAKPSKQQRWELCEGKVNW